MAFFIFIFEAEGAEESLLSIRQKNIYISKNLTNK